MRNISPEVKKFLRLGAAFLLPVILFGLFAEWRLSYIDTPFTIKRRLFDESLAKSQVLVLGSSQSLFGIDPDYFSKPGYNAAYVSQDLFYDTEIVKRYLGQMPNLKLVIMPIAYFSLNLNLSETPEAWRDAYYWHSWGIKHTPGYELKYHSLTAFYGSHALDFLLRGNTGDSSSGVNEGIKPSGWQHNPTHLSHAEIYAENVRDKVLAQKGLDQANKGMNVNNIDENLSALDATADALKRRGVKLYFITIPIFTTYTKYEDDDQWLFIHEKLASLCAKENCHYKDYERDSRFNIDDFADGDHFNTQGAVKFSTILNNDIVVPELSELKK